MDVFDEMGVWREQVERCLGIIHDMQRESKSLKARITAIQAAHDQVCLALKLLDEEVNRDD